jgi:hypothetical protein
MPEQESVTLGCNSCVLTNPSAPNRGADISPVEGVILRWRLDGGRTASPPGENPSYRLRVLSRQGQEYVGAGTSAAVAPLHWAAVEVFPTHLPIKVGQLIGLELENGESNIRFGFSSAVDSVFLEPAMADGMSRTPSTLWENGFVFPFDAEVLPPPVIIGVGPGEGPPAGGNQVAIEGENFAAVTGVSFGNTEVAYTVASESKLLATAPPGVATDSVPVAVVTAAGRAEAASYRYEAPKAGPTGPSTGCVVPRLKGKRLAAVRRILRHDDCRLGRIGKTRHATRRPGRVKRQSPPPGTQLGEGGAVDVTVGGAS